MVWTTPWKGTATLQTAFCTFVKSLTQILVGSAITATGYTKEWGGCG